MPVTLNASTASGLIATSDTSGNIELQSNGTTKATVSSTGLAIGQYNPSASLITSGTAVASTSGTSIDFTGIPSWVKRVTVLCSGVSSNGSSSFIVQVGAGSIVTTGYGSTMSLAVNAVLSTSNISTGLLFQTANQSTNSYSGIMVLATLGSNLWVASVNTNEVTGTRAMFGAGNISLGGALDRVRITTVNGTDTFDAGTINILYE